VRVENGHDPGQRLAAVGVFGEDDVWHGRWLREPPTNCSDTFARRAASATLTSPARIDNTIRTFSTTGNTGALLILSFLSGTQLCPVPRSLTRGKLARASYSRPRCGDQVTSPHDVDQLPVPSEFGHQARGRFLSQGAIQTFPAPGAYRMGSHHVRIGDRSAPARKDRDAPQDFTANVWLRSPTRRCGDTGDSLQ
jgi:hypothetical protein